MYIVAASRVGAAREMGMVIGMDSAAIVEAIRIAAARLLDVRINC